MSNEMSNLESDVFMSTIYAEIEDHVSKLLHAAWESGYWLGMSHTGPINDDAVLAKNPFKK